ncbi:MFS transporter [Eubacteriales bacterium OttesenSCG-928-A19]|nr:MFS transporter [Eubacteriales bacterium OttesenSCG-928-A19]
MHPAFPCDILASASTRGRKEVSSMQATANTGWKRNTAVFMTSQAISLFGSTLVQFAITWYITLTTQSGVYMTISIMCSLLPLLLVSPFAGVWADRYDRKKLIMISDSAIALSTLVLAIVFMSGYREIWLLLAVSTVRALGGAVQTPAVNALLPDLVPEEQLTRVNGLNGSIQSLLSLASPALAGALLNIVGSIELIFFIDVITAAIAVVIMLRFLRVPARERAETEAERGGYFREMREGMAYARKHPYLMHLLGFTVVICFCVAPVSFLTPLQVVRNYGEEVWRLTAIEITFSVGMLLGGLLISAWGGLKNRIQTMGLSIVPMGLLTVLLGVPIPFWLYLAFMALVGLSLPMFNTPAMVLLQEKVDGAYLGRIFSIVSMVNGGVMPLAMLLFGPLADAVPIDWLLIATGVVILITGGVLLMDRVVLRAGRPGPVPES